MLIRVAVVDAGGLGLRQTLSFRVVDGIYMYSGGGICWEKDSPVMNEII